MTDQRIVLARLPRLLIGSGVSTICVALSALGFAVAAHGASLTTLHSFTGSDGGFPAAPVVLDKQGNLYGTTELGGSGNYGTIFELDTSHNEITLYNFCTQTNCTDGASPAAGLLRYGNGKLFGTTFAGGSDTDCGSGNGCGTAFELATNGALTTLHSFTGSDGTFTYAKLLKGKMGALYGTTFEGAAGYGTAFRLSKTGTETVLYTFTGGADGAYPSAGLVEDSAGNLYGMTREGGAAGAGAVFEINTAGTETVLYSFTGGSDGAKPFGGLIRDKFGNFYGTTQQGGTSNLGTVFEVSPTGAETVLHSFAGGSDGSTPYTPLVAKGRNLYGTTYVGGTANDGTVFEISSKGIETVLHSFSGSDGASPDAGLILDSSGDLYGTTFSGGTSGLGTVFELTP
jgi:uncharacterized repeat protein (TIGR03803 family)